MYKIILLLNDSFNSIVKIIKQLYDMLKVSKNYFTIYYS